MNSIDTSLRIQNPEYEFLKTIILVGLQRKSFPKPNSENAAMCIRPLFYQNNPFLPNSTVQTQSKLIKTLIYCYLFVISSSKIICISIYTVTQRSGFEAELSNYFRWHYNWDAIETPSFGTVSNLFRGFMWHTYQQLASMRYSTFCLK